MRTFRDRAAHGTGTMSDLLFVYGTLRPASGEPLARRLAGLGSGRGSGWFEGRLYDLGDYPGAVAAPGAGRVHGELFALGDQHPLWAELDDYEDVRAGLAAFARVVLDAWSDDAGAFLRAQAYVFRGATDGHPLIAGGDWLAVRRP
jgi:gamma-glutamylcyclotransferase (GGCT)/AIG2-like uncharacterized protein YtfP